MSVFLFSPDMLSLSYLLVHNLFVFLAHSHRLFSAWGRSCERYFFNKHHACSHHAANNYRSGLLSVDCVCQGKVKRNKLEVL